MAAPAPKEIREAYTDYRSDWQEIRDQAASDMQAISVEGPWPAETRQAREDKQRPCVHLDQINQYLNQVIGNVRKTKRAIKIDPKGNGANDKDAEKRQGLARGIEERSQAQPIYLNAFECQIQRSYGFAVIRTDYKDNTSFDLEIIIKPVMNPDTVLFSPYYKQPDASDVPEAFLLDLIARKDYKAKWPKATITDFRGEVMKEQGVSDWITDKHVQIGEFWRVEQTKSKLFLIQVRDEPAPRIFTEEQWKQEKAFGRQGEVKRERDVQTPKVMQYMTNGLEILDETEWKGTRIPIIAAFGPERWTNKGGQPKRELLSMVRFARDPQLLFDFLATQECELAGQVPKTPFIGAVGQFETDLDRWEALNSEPTPFVQYDLKLDAAGATAPPPNRTDYSAPFDQYELAKDSAGRSLQASMGITPLPTAAARRSEKSGVALEKIDDMEQLGSFHFVDRYENCFLHNMGFQINELITPILDTEREMPIAEPDGKRKLMQVVGNTSHPIDKETGVYDVQGLDEDHIHTGKGEFGVTISTGPSYDSERDEQAEFADSLLENMQTLPMPGTPAAKVLALAIRMRPTLGPIGQQIAAIFDPPDPSNLPPEAQAIVAQLQGQVQELSQENQALHLERAGKVLELKSKQTIEAMKGKHVLDKATMDFITQIVKAELAAKSKSSDQQAQQDADAELAALGFHQAHTEAAFQAAHEHAMQQDQQTHEADQADQAAQTAAVQQATQISADQAQQGAQEA